MKNRFNIILLFVILPIIGFSQSIWKSSKYSYSIEVPKGFIKSKAIGANVDFRAGNGVNSIVIVIKKFPDEYVKNSIWDLLGDLNKFGPEFENGAKEYMKNPRFIKSGKTLLSGLDTFWYDYTHENFLYSKVYQTKKGNKLYTITLSCRDSEYNHYSSIWLRFKDKIKIN